MRTGRRLAALASVVALMASAAGAAEVCVTNGSEHAYLFAAEAGPGTRVTEVLAPGTMLCAGPAPAALDRGVVSVFPEPDALEGCSRLVAPGDGETLLRYAAFDRCLWSSHQVDHR